MKKLSLLFLLSVFFFQSIAQTDKEKQKLKEISLQAYESVSQTTRQWFADASRQHPDGKFDTAFAKRKLKEKFSVSELTSTGDILMVMMAFQKMLDKEAKDDRQMMSYLKKLLLASKAEKQKINNEKIDEGMKEAREKADRAMANAVTQLVTSNISASIQIAAASISGQEKQHTSAKDSTKPKTISIPATHNKSEDNLSFTLYIKKLEDQLTILKKEKSQ